MPKRLRTCKRTQIYDKKRNKCISKKSKYANKILITENTTKIGGPSIFYYYRVKIGKIIKKIYLFGEEHTKYNHKKSYDTIHISTLIKKIIRNTDQCIDIFVEDIVYQKDYNIKNYRGGGKSIATFSDPISSIRNIFSKCSKHSLNKNKCNYDNIRYHNWDLRMVLATSNIKGKWRTNPLDELLLIDKYLNTLKSRYSIEVIIKYILGFETKYTKEINEYVENSISEARINNKNFRKNASLNKNIIHYIQNIIQKSYHKMIRKNKFPKNFLNTFIQSYKKQHDYDFTIVFTDYYLLSRLFTEFDKSTKKVKRTPRLCKVTGKNNFLRSKNIIIYGGSSHIFNIKTFLELMFSVKPIWFTEKEILNKKINIKHIKSINNYKFEEISQLLHEFSG